MIRLAVGRERFAGWNRRSIWAAAQATGKCPADQPIEVHRGGETYCRAEAGKAKDEPMQLSGEHSRPDLAKLFDLDADTAARDQSTDSPFAAPADSLRTRAQKPPAPKKRPATKKPATKKGAKKPATNPKGDATLYAPGEDEPKTMDKIKEWYRDNVETGVVSDMVDSLISVSGLNPHGSKLGQLATGLMQSPTKLWEAVQAVGNFPPLASAEKRLQKAMRGPMVELATEQAVQQAAKRAKQQQAEAQQRLQVMQQQLQKLHSAAGKPPRDAAAAKQWLQQIPEGPARRAAHEIVSLGQKVDRLGKVQQDPAGHMPPEVLQQIKLAPEQYLERDRGVTLRAFQKFVGNTLERAFGGHE